jgi:hypothetical protein
MAMEMSCLFLRKNLGEEPQALLVSVMLRVLRVWMSIVSRLLRLSRRLVGNFDYTYRVCIFGGVLVCAGSWCWGCYLEVGQQAGLCK